MGIYIQFSKFYEYYNILLCNKENKKYQHPLSSRQSAVGALKNLLLNGAQK